MATFANDFALIVAERRDGAHSLPPLVNVTQGKGVAGENDQKADREEAEVVEPRVHGSSQSVSDEFRVADNIVPAIVIVRIAVQNAPGFVRDHFQSFLLVWIEARPIGAVGHRGLDSLRDASVFVEAAVTGAALSQGCVDVGHTGSTRKVDGDPMRAVDGAAPHAANSPPLSFAYSRTVQR